MLKVRVFLVLISIRRLLVVAGKRFQYIYIYIYIYVCMYMIYIL